MTNSTEAIRVSDERLSEMQRDCGIPNPPTQETYWFRKALAGEGPHAYDWSDKPHRLVFDLCRLIEADAALRSNRVAGIEVKPLEWELLGGDSWRASALFFGSFRVENFASGYIVLWSAPGISDTFIEGRWPTAEAAKAAAEADYRNRILSALLPKATAPVVSERREIETEAEALQRLADGDRIVYSRDGEAAWFQNGDRAFVDDVVILDLHLSGLIETLNDGEDEDWHEWSQITDKGRAALTAALEARNG